MERESGRAGERERWIKSVSPPFRLIVSSSSAPPLSRSPCLSFSPSSWPLAERSALLPPERRETLHVENLSVEQRGAHLILSLPFTRTPKTQLQRIDVYRLVEQLEAPMGLPIETFSEKASVVYSILADDIPLNRSGVIYNDALNVKGEAQNKRYRYSVRMFNTAGQANDFSTYATIEPLLNLALPPAKLAAKQVETQIEITWDPPEGNM